MVARITDFICWRGARGRWSRLHVPAGTHSLCGQVVQNDFILLYAPRDPLDRSRICKLCAAYWVTDRLGVRTAPQHLERKRLWPHRKQP